MRSLPQDKAAFLGVLARRIVPETAALDQAGQTRFFSVIDQALAARPRAVQRQFAIFLGVIRWAPLARYASSFDRLTPARQDAVLRWFEDNPVGALRSGTWGLKTMVFMGYYGQPETNASVGYQPALEGPDGAHA
jgi:hypothetical protein